MITRRSVMLGGAAIVVAAAMPMISHAGQQPNPNLIADMFYTQDEPWGAFVRGHIAKSDFDVAVLRMIEVDSDAKENGEDWLWEGRFDDEGEEIIKVVIGEPEHIYMRLGEIDPIDGERWYFCKQGDEGALPITAVRY